MLQSLSSRLSGEGVEFGAGCSPFPVPAGVRVRHADRNTVAQLQAREYFGDLPVVTPELQSDLESMDAIEDDSLDFIIASHVIEHTRSPLRALQQAYRKLRRGGQFLLVVPDKEVTFDRERALTDLAHLILDFHSPSRERDWHHYVEFFEKAFPKPDPAAAAIVPAGYRVLLRAREVVTAAASGRPSKPATDPATWPRAGSTASSRTRARPPHRCASPTKRPASPDRDTSSP